MAHVLLKRIGFIIYVAGIVMAGCKQDDRSELTNPNQLSKAPLMANFITTDDRCTTLETSLATAVFFVCGVKPGDVEITYTTPAGTFCVVAEVQRDTTLAIGLQIGEIVTSASLQTGALYDRSQSTWPESDATLYAWPGGPQCNAVFRPDQSAPIVLEEPEVEGKCGYDCEKEFETDIAASETNLTNCIQRYSGVTTAEECEHTAFDKFTNCYTGCPSGQDGACYYDCQDAYLFASESCGRCEDTYEAEETRITKSYNACISICLSR
jgi:hypothetical protein